MSLQSVEGKGPTAAKGFRVAGVAAGIKESGALDLMLLASDVDASAAGVFTTNTAAAAPVIVSRERVTGGKARAVVANSGCANCMTGKQGHDDALAMAANAALQLDVGQQNVLVCSTGHIGSLLPMTKVKLGIAKAAKGLGDDDEAAARAIMTTDTKPKLAAVSSAGWSLGGMAKGAGMIAPNMATMLAFVTTDALVGPGLLRSVLLEAVESSFNRIVIDGDMSTNDSVIALANGISGVTPDRGVLEQAMSEICGSLADQMVRDGEGVTKFVKIEVKGALSDAEAEKAARQLATSVLVKTALYGGDANWGRIAAAIGASGVETSIERMSISMGGISLLEGGVSTNREGEGRKALEKADVEVTVDLAAGTSNATILTTDLSEENVRLNAEYE